MTKRYLIIAEYACPDCDGDGWRITEDKWDTCPTCRGDGFVTEQVAELTQAQVLPYLTAIPDGATS